MSFTLPDLHLILHASPYLPHLTCLTLLASQLRKPIGYPAGHHGLYSASRLQGRGLPKHVGRVRMGEQGQALLTLPLHLHFHPLLRPKRYHPVLYDCIKHAWYICFSSHICPSLLVFYILIFLCHDTLQVAINTNLLDLREYLDHIIANTNMTCLTPLGDADTVSLQKLYKCLLTDLLHVAPSYAALLYLSLIYLCCTLLYCFGHTCS